MANPRVQAAMDAALKKSLNTKVSGEVTPPVAAPDSVAAIPSAVTPDANATPPVVSAATSDAAVATPPAASADAFPSFMTESVTPPPPAQPAVPPAPAATDKEINFANLRKAKEAAEQKLSQVYDADGKVKADFIKSLNVQSPDAERLQRELDATRDTLAKYDLQADPRWQQKYSAQENAALNSIMRFAQEYQVKPEDLQNAMGMGLKERTTFFMEKMPNAVAMIAPHLATLDNIVAQKQADLSNARQVSQAMQDQTAVQREQAIRESRDALCSQTIRELAQSGLYVFNERPGDETWNSGVAKVKATVGELLTTQDIHVQSRAMAMGAAAPVLLSHVKQQDKIIKELRTQLKLHSGAGATISTGNSVTPSAPVDMSKMSPKELAAMAVSSVRKNSQQK